MDGQIKLMGGYSERSGHVEICSNQRWETLLLSDWEHDEAKVACNTLGYRYGMLNLCIKGVGMAMQYETKAGDGGMQF